MANRGGGGSQGCSGHNHKWTLCTVEGSGCTVKCVAQRVVCNVNLQCEFSVSMCSVDLQCGCAVWMCSVDVQCGCAV